MAETCNIAFGRYLRILRERRGLSLEEVQTLSRTFPDPLDKGYVSRCENGLRRLAFSKVAPLSRIYEVPADVLVERMELDMELDRVGGPTTEGLSYEELLNAGRQAVNRGFNWTAYAFLRDAVVAAQTNPVSDRYLDRAEQFTVSELNCGSACLNLGRTGIALHEFGVASASSNLSDRFLAISFERLSQCYRRLRQFAPSRSAAGQSIELAETLRDRALLGYVYSNRALIAIDERDGALACRYLERAYRNYRASGLMYECARTLNNLAQAYFDLRRLRAARKAIAAAARLSAPLDQHRATALGKILLGEIEVLEQRDCLAQALWSEAAEIAKRLDDKVLRFKAEFQLYKLAMRLGNVTSQRVLQRRLANVVPWIPADTVELSEFKSLAS